MKKNTTKNESSKNTLEAFYKTQRQRKNLIKHLLFGLFSGLASYPRLLLEVWVRKTGSFGERYFSFASAVTIAIIMALIPYGILKTGSGWEEFDWWVLISRYMSWYIFLIMFIKICNDHRIALKREPSVFDLAKYTLSTGAIDPKFKEFKINGKVQNKRTIETLMEPAFFLIIGLVLCVLAQPIGIVITVSSICYSLSYFADYYFGDQFVMDTLDVLIRNREIANDFMDGKGPEETSGFHFYGARPSDPDIRKTVVDSFMDHKVFSEAF